MKQLNLYSYTPLHRVRIALTVIAAIILQCGVTRAQTAQNTVVMSVPEVGRNVGIAVHELQKRYRYVITYEDVIRVHDEDLADVTERVSKNLDKYPPGGGPRIIVPHDPSLVLNVPSSPTITTQQMASILNQLMQVQASTGRGGHFRVQQVGNVFHVMPTEVRDRNGNWTAYTPILDTLISLPMKNRSEPEMIDDICNAVSAASTVKIKTGMGLRIPGLGLGSIGEDGAAIPPVVPTYPLGANNEKARDVLTRALALLADRRLSWYANYDSMDHMYYLSFEDITAPKN